MITQLDSVWLTLTRACNARCQWCYAADTEFKPRDTMSLEVVSDLLEIIEGMNCSNVVLIGGEPTTHPLFFEILRRINEKGFSTGLVTNGLLFSDIEFVKKTKEHGVTAATLSLKAPNDQEYQEATLVKRGFSRFEKAIENCNKEGLFVNLSVTVTDTFIKQINDFTQSIIDLNPGYVEFGLANPVIFSDSVSAPNIPNPQQHADAVKAIHEQMKGSGIGYCFEMKIPLCLLDPELKSDLLANSHIRHSCHVPTGNAVVFNEKGNVLPCNFFASHEMGRLGVEYSNGEEFLSFWNQKKAEDFRKEISRFPHQNCQTCSDWDMCGGGCPIQWMHWVPDDYIGRIQALNL